MQPDNTNVSITDAPIDVRLKILDLFGDAQITLEQATLTLDLLSEQYVHTSDYPIFCVVLELLDKLRLQLRETELFIHSLEINDIPATGATA